MCITTNHRNDKIYASIRQFASRSSESFEVRTIAALASSEIITKGLFPGFKRRCPSSRWVYAHSRSTFTEQFKTWKRTNCPECRTANMLIPCTLSHFCSKRVQIFFLFHFIVLPTRMGWKSGSAKFPTKRNHSTTIAEEKWPSVLTSSATRSYWIYCLKSTSSFSASKKMWFLSGLCTDRSSIRRKKCWYGGEQILSSSKLKFILQVNHVNKRLYKCCMSN